jgi:CheY-like chemotaxis protein
MFLYQKALLTVILGCETWNSNNCADIKLRGSVVKKKVLIVEDTLLNREMAKDLLELEGYIVVVAEEGKEAIEKARKERPDIILLDMVLPDIDGLAVIEMLKDDSQTRDIIIVALTGQVEESDKKRALDAGCSGYITKPIDTRKFARQIGEFLKMT